MDQSVQKRLKKVKNIKSKLIQARNVIKNKFQKAYKNRIQNERKLNEKYKPITSAIEKLREQQGETVPSTSLIEKKSRKKFRLPSLRGFGGGNDSDDPSDPENPNDPGNRSDPGIWKVTDYVADNLEPSNLKNDESWKEVDLPASSNDDADGDGDDDEKIWDTDIDVSPSGRRIYTTHQRSDHFPALRFADDYDDNDGAGPSHATVFDPMDYEEERLKRLREGVGTEPGKRIKLSYPVRLNALNTKRKKLQAKDIANARKLREAVIEKARTDARASRDIQLPISSASSTYEPTTHDSRVSKIIELESSDGDDGYNDENIEFVKQSGFRTTEKRRRPQNPKRMKLYKVPTVSDIAKKIRAKYALSNRLPKSLAKKYRARSFPSQQNPYNLEPRVPAISNPYITKDHILYRTVVPPVPDTTPVLDQSKSKEKKKDQKKISFLYD